MTLQSRVAGCLVFALCTFVYVGGAGAQTDTEFFNDQSLQRIDLLVHSRDWEKLKANFQENEYYPADMIWQGVTVRNLGIRSRGFGSRSGVKPGLRVDFDRYATDQTFLGLKSFILDNLTQDPSGLRERVAMKFYERMGLPAPREAHVAVYVNDAYVGLYAIVESIDKDFLRRVFGEQAGDVENDGHLYEYEYVSPWYFDYLGSDLEAYAALFDPVTHENASASELYAPIEAMVRAISQASNQTFVSAVTPYLNLALFVKHVAVQSFLAEWDGILGYAGVNNFYFYRFEDSLEARFISWDADNTFRSIDYPVTAGHDENVLMRRAMQVPELRAAFFTALAEAAASAMELVPATDMGWLQWEIGRQLTHITLAMQLDPVKPYTNAEFAASANELAVFARERSAFVACEVAQLTESAEAPRLCARP